MAITAFLSRFPGLLNWGPGAKPLQRHGSHSNIFSPTLLNLLSLGLYNNLTSCELHNFALNSTQSTVKVAPDLLISSTGCTCYLHRYISSFDSLAGSEVNMQHLPSHRYNTLGSVNFLCFF